MRLPSGNDHEQTDFSACKTIPATAFGDLSTINCLKVKMIKKTCKQGIGGNTGFDYFSKKLKNYNHLGNNIIVNNIVIY